MTAAFFISRIERKTSAEFQYLLFYSRHSFFPTLDQICNELSDNFHFFLFHTPRCYCRGTETYTGQIGNEPSDYFHFFLFHTSRCYCRGTETNTGSEFYPLCIKRNRIFVCRDICCIKQFLYSIAGLSLAHAVRKHHMVIRSSGHEADSQPVRRSGGIKIGIADGKYAFKPDFDKKFEEMDAEVAEMFG